jgi:hypothetical protein
LAGNHVYFQPKLHFLRYNTLFIAQKTDQTCVSQEALKLQQMKTDLYFSRFTLFLMSNLILVMEPNLLKNLIFVLSDPADPRLRLFGL